MKKAMMLASMMSLIAGPAWAASTDAISQWGITWTFDKPYEYGQYANGDYWVFGPVIITTITPAFDGHNNGWEVNPAYSNPVLTTEPSQGFDEDVGYFAPALAPSLPYTAHGGESIVKSVSSGNSGRLSLQTAAVLTVVDEAPPDQGVSVFRPPYVGTNKPNYSTNDIRWNILPSLSKTAHAPPLSWVVERYGKVQLDHKGGSLGQNLHPVDNYLGKDYGGNIGIDNTDAIMRLMLDDPLEDKIFPVICLLQYGLDIYHMALEGHTWPAGGGHRPGQKIAMSFAALLLNHSGMADMVKNRKAIFQEDNGLQWSRENVPVFGFTLNDGQDEEGYWWTIYTGMVNGSANASGYKTRSDPYFYIDGGLPPNATYQIIHTPSWIPMALVLRLMPSLQTVWNSPLFLAYADRWVNGGGFWMHPDPCAPCDGDWTHYGITYGPDGHGGCILGDGRFPELHGKMPAMDFTTIFAKEMWAAYRGAPPPPAPKAPARPQRLRVRP